MARKFNLLDQVVLKEVTCLGWCGRKTFFQQYLNDRYCKKCKEIKNSLEKNMSKREIKSAVNTCLPEGVEIHPEEVS